MIDSLKQDFFKYQAQTTDNPLIIEVDRAEGVFIWDTSGKKYYDLISGIGVANLGHRHPKVLEAINNQTQKYLHVMAYGEFIQKPQVDLAKMLSSWLPDSLSCSYFVNSGTEANEAAVKLAKRFTGRHEIISFKNSYHGNTQGSLSITGNESKKYAFRPLLPNIKFLAFNSQTDLEKISTKTACVIIEPVQGDAGVRIPSVDFMKKLRKKCNATETLLIFDEVQTAMGRTGKMFAFEHFGVTPDIITLAKAFGGGMPIGAFISSKKIMNALKSNPMLGHITTFGGHPVCCAAALASLNVFREDNLLVGVGEKGKLFKKLLSNNKNVVEVRQIGLMLAVQLKDFDTVYKVVNRCLEKGVIGFWFLSCNNSFRIAPPLIITEKQIEECCEIINESIDYKKSKTNLISS